MGAETTPEVLADTCGDVPMPDDVAPRPWRVSGADARDHGDDDRITPYARGEARRSG